MAQLDLSQFVARIELDILTIQLIKELRVNNDVMKLIIERFIEQTGLYFNTLIEKVNYYCGSYIFTEKVAMEINQLIWFYFALNRKKFEHLKLHFKCIVNQRRAIKY